MTSTAVSILETPPRTGTLLIAATAVPAILATMLVVVFAAFESSGTTLSAIAPANVAEAAALGLGGETLRRVRMGEDATARLDVRSEVISSSVKIVTALEAAVFARQVELIRMFDRRGSIADPALRRDLVCLAADLDVRDIVEYLGAAEAATCPPGAARAAIVQR
jgi:hypothetical protein